MASQVKRVPAKLRDQLARCIVAIDALGASWPAFAPTKAEVQTAHDDLELAITEANAARAAMKIKNEARDRKRDDGVQIGERVRTTAILIYGRSGSGLLSFGVTTGGHLPDLRTLVKIKIADGVLPGSIALNWENIQGAIYEIQWATAPAFDQIAGAAVSTSSKFSISGLTSGTQYWIRVRPHRGGQTAAWADPATRIAPV